MAQAMAALRSGGNSFSFAVFTGTFSLFLTTTFWARMASLHARAESKRVYGVIAAGAHLPNKARIAARAG